MLAEGQMVGPYQLIRPLGAGAFGEVWLAHHMDLAADFALKIPTDPEYVKQLRKEGVITFSVRHPNIVHLHHIDTWHSPPFLAMEFVDGEDLSRRLARDGKLPTAEALSILRQVLEALHAAHAHGVVHRDLKPSNILLAHDGTVKVGDFGLGSLQSKVVQSLVVSGSLVTAEGKSVSGTIAYMSPEQQAGNPPDPRDDLYAAGVVGCELLTGRRPSAAGVGRSLARAGVPVEVAAVLEQACDELEYRYPSAADMLEAMRALGAPTERRRTQATPPPLPARPAARQEAPAAAPSVSTGVAKLNKALRTTLGPRGQAVPLMTPDGLRLTRKGTEVLARLPMEGPAEQLAAELLRPVGLKTAELVGDGAATAALLATEIFLAASGAAGAAAGAPPLQQGIRAAVEPALDRLRKLSRPASDADLKAVATFAADGDQVVASVILDSMTKVGRKAPILVEAGAGVATTVEIVEGMEFDRGYLSPHFVTDAAKGLCVLEDAYVLLHEGKLAELIQAGMVPLIEKIAGARKPLLVVAGDVMDDALKMLATNKMKGVLECAAVQAPGYGDRRKAMLGDIAALTGGRAFLEGDRVALKDVQLTHLGRVKKAIISADSTTLVEGAGASDAIRKRLDQLKQEIETTTSDYDREKFQERREKLAGGVAVVRVGGATSGAIDEMVARVEAALRATRSAVEEGVVPGGGIALVRAGEALDGLGASGPEATGADILRIALAAPFEAILGNAGRDPEAVLAKVLSSKAPGAGFDVVAGEYADLFRKPIVDSAKVLRIALSNAVEGACLLQQASA